jgi:hypothetical protein
MAIKITVENTDALDANTKYEVTVNDELVATLAHGETYHDVVDGEVDIAVGLVDTLSEEDDEESSNTPEEKTQP